MTKPESLTLDILHNCLEVKQMVQELIDENTRLTIDNEKLRVDNGNLLEYKYICQDLYK